MSPRAGERSKVAMRRRGGWRGLFADPVRKLFALALATLLWLFLDSQITERMSVTFKLIGPRMASEAAQSEIQDSHIVVHPPNGYRVVGFRDHLTNTDLTFVVITFEAAQHLLRSAIASPGLNVQLRQAEINKTTNIYVFDSDDLLAPDPAVIKAISEMTPRRIDVLLEPIEERPLALDKNALRIEYPDRKAFPDFPDRLRLDEAVFTPAQVILRGPKSVIGDVGRTDPLFVLDLSRSGGTNEPRVTGELQPIPIDRLLIDGLPVSVSVPLSPRFEPVELTVPVLVDAVGRSTPPGEFVYEPAVKVTLMVSGELAGALSRLQTQAERDAWARQNARVDIRLDDYWRNEDQTMIGTLRLIDPHYERGRHYRTDETISVRFRPKGKE